VNEKLTLLFVVGVLLLNYPVLAIFNRSVAFGGVPVLYLYLFVVWALGIGVVCLLARRRWEGDE
jgi:hypothetical protein